MNCKNDTDGDGDCAFCARRGGCQAIGGPFEKGGMTRRGFLRKIGFGAAAAAIAVPLVMASRNPKEDILMEYARKDVEFTYRLNAAQRYLWADEKLVLRMGRQTGKTKSHTIMFAYHAREAGRITQAEYEAIVMEMSAC